MNSWYLNKPDEDWYWPVEISPLNSISPFLISPCKSLLDCNVFNLIYYHWSRSFWFLDPTLSKPLIVHGFCSGFFTLTKQFKIVLSFAILYGRQIKSNAEFCVIREKADFIPVNRAWQCRVPLSTPATQANAERQWIPTKQALWLGSSTLTTTWCVSGVQFNVIFQSVLIFNTPWIEVETFSSFKLSGLFEIDRIKYHVAGVLELAYQYSDQITYHVKSVPNLLPPPFLYAK